MASSSTMDEDVSLTDILDVELPSEDSQALHKLNEEAERGLDEELHRLSDETKRLKDEVKRLQDEVKRLSDENLSYKEEVIRLKIELEEHKKEKETLLKETLESKKVLENENSDLKNINDSLKQEKERLSKYVFSLERFTSDEDMSFYTGFPNYGTFCALLDYLNPGLQGENIRYCNQSERDVPDDNYNTQEEEIEYPKAKKGRPKKLKTDVEFFMVMCRLRRGFTVRHLTHLFAVAQSTTSRSYTAWINFMYLKFSTINTWPSQEVVRQTMPQQFKEKFPSTRVIIDCAEVKCEMPSSLLLNSELFSSYKNHTTLKGLIGIAPNGAVTFASQLYTGSISDREIVIHSGLLSQQFNDGDSVMADKGFTIDDLLPLGTSLNIPPFLGQNAQMEPSDVIKTQQIASLRIHVE